MEEVARTFGSANCWDWNNFRFRIFDRFGSMHGFHVRGSTKFQTKFGSLMTIGWLVMITLAFFFYLDKLLDKSAPSMQRNRYRATESANADFKKENFHFFWSFKSL